MKKENQEWEYKVAVYGTLKKGEGNHGLLEGAKFIGKGTTLPSFDMVSMGGFPGVIKGDKKISVEVYEITSKELHRLDNLEGHPNFYRRERVDINLDNKEVVSALMYRLANQKPYQDRPKIVTRKEDAISWHHYTTSIDSEDITFCEGC